MHTPVPYKQGFELIRRHLADDGRKETALCGIELRCPKPFSFDGFAQFNAEYAAILKEWGVFVDDVNPVARTNVAPESAGPAEPSLYGFSYTRRCRLQQRPTFVVAGAGELPEGILAAEGIVSRGDTSAQGIAVKARFVIELMEARLTGLGAGWPSVTAIDVYTVHPIHHFLHDVILARAGAAAVHGIRWFYSRPPIEEIEFEMDLRGVHTEIRID
jgi:hypothetical protein